VEPKSVRLSKASYFADFAVYPPVVLALLILALRQAPSLVWIEWSIACLARHRGVDLAGIRHPSLGVAPDPVLCCDA